MACSYYTSPFQPPFAWSWANAASRLATSTNAADIGKVGFQTDIGLRYALTSYGWKPLTDPNMGIERNIVSNNATASFTSVGLAPTTGAGTVTAIGFTGATLATQIARTSIRSAAGAGSLGVYRASGNSCPHSIDGFRWEFIFTLEEVSANFRWFVGVRNNAFTTNVDPATVTDIFGIGRSGSGDANVQLYNNDSVGSADKTSLVGFAAGTANKLYNFKIWTLNGSSYAYALKDLITLSEVSGTVNTNIPANNNSMQFNVYCSNDTDAANVSIGINSIRHWQPESA